MKGDQNQNLQKRSGFGGIVQMGERAAVCLAHTSAFFFGPRVLKVPTRLKSCLPNAALPAVYCRTVKTEAAVFTLAAT